MIRRKSSNSHRKRGETGPKVAPYESSKKLLLMAEVKMRTCLLGKTRGPIPLHKRVRTIAIGGTTLTYPSSR